MSRTLSLSERETIITFDEAVQEAIIFTYSKVWQNHLEKKLGLTRLSDNGYGGREYELPKKMIKPPRVHRKVSAETRERLRKQLTRIRPLRPAPESKNKSD